MKLLYTEQAINSLQEVLNFFPSNISSEKLIEIKNEILDAADTLLIQPYKGQSEIYLEHLNLGHRRIVVGNYKIIYRVEGEIIYITDIFDARQDPDKMKS